MAAETTMDRHFLERVASLLDAHLGEERFGVRELAREAGISRSQLHRKLNTLKGKSSSRYIREYRLDKAMELLQQGAGTASEISYKVGFNSPTYFSTCFHEYFGYPPGEVKYRNNLKQKAGVSKGYLPDMEKARKRLLWLFVLGILLVLATSFVVFLGSRDQQSEPSRLIEVSAAGEKSIGVLPFTNLSGDTAFEYISDGMTDAIIAKLAKINSFGKVVPFTTMVSFKDTEKTIAEIAAELGVTHLLEGNVQMAGDTVKIGLRLIDGMAETYYWSDDYRALWTSDELFRMQSNVAESVVKNMKIAISPDEQKMIRSYPTTSSDAYKYYTLAQFQHRKYTKVSLDNAISLYEKAVALDPKFVEAYMGLGSCWDNKGWMGFIDEREAISTGRKYLYKALALDPNNEVIKDQLIACHFMYDWDFERIEEHYQQLLQKNELYKWNMMIDYAIKTGRIEEAYVAVERALSADPTDYSLYGRKAFVLLESGDIEKALEEMEGVYSFFSDNWWFRKDLAWLYYLSGDMENTETSIAYLSKDMEAYPYTDIWLLMALTDSRSSKVPVKNPFLSKLMDYYETRKPGSPAWHISLYYAAIGNQKSALDWLNNSFQRREPGITWLYAEHLLKPLRNDPIFKDLLNKVGFTKILSNGKI